MAEEILVGPQSLSNNAKATPRGGKMGESVISQVWGKYGELCQQGYVFVARTAAAAAIPIYSTLTNAPAIWNPASSTKLIVPLQINLSVGAIGTPILNGITLSYLTAAGDNIGTGAPVVTWTNVAPTNLLIGSSGACTCKFAPAVSTYTTQPTVLMDIGIGHHLEGTAAIGQMYQLQYDFDSLVQLKPGCTLHIGSTIATSTTYWTTLIFAEIPLLN